MSVPFACMSHAHPALPAECQVPPRSPRATAIAMTADAGTLPVVVDNRHVGLLLKTGATFRFIAADPALHLLDGSQFFRAELVQRAANAMKRAAGDAEPRGISHDAAQAWRTGRSDIS
jgi:hypothetical protein